MSIQDAPLGIAALNHVTSEQCTTLNRNTARQYAPVLSIRPLRSKARQTTSLNQCDSVQRHSTPHLSIVTHHGATLQSSQPCRCISALRVSSLSIASLHEESTRRSQSGQDGTKRFSQSVHHFAFRSATLIKSASKMVIPQSGSFQHSQSAHAAPRQSESAHISQSLRCTQTRYNTLNRAAALHNVSLLSITSFQLDTLNQYASAHLISPLSISPVLFAPLRLSQSNRFTTSSCIPLNRIAPRRSTSHHFSQSNRFTTSGCIPLNQIRPHHVAPLNQFETEHSVPSLSISPFHFASHLSIGTFRPAPRRTSQTIHAVPSHLSQSFRPWAYRLSQSVHTIPERIRSLNRLRTNHVVSRNRFKS